MTEFQNYLKKRISKDGPLTIAQYMEESLGNPQHGYYMTRDPLGADGDFITSPEISQMFGELLGLWCIVQWQMMGAPSSFNFVELGPGRGTLMADMLRAGRAVPGFVEAAKVSLVETSPVLRKKQKELLRAYDPRWIGDLSRLPDGPVIAIANEFFDALPVRQFEHSAVGWHERVIGVDEDDNLCFKLTKPQHNQPLVPEEFQHTKEGDVVEVSPASIAVAVALSVRIKEAGGAALIIDYGHYESAVGDTLQAMKGHHYHPVLELPGEADLTAHVDFASLVSVAKDFGAAAHGPITQAHFLEALGIKARAEILLKKATPEQATDINSALERLISTEGTGMGKLFKVLALTQVPESSDVPPPPGF